MTGRTKLLGEVLPVLAGLPESDEEWDKHEERVRVQQRKEARQRERERLEMRRVLVLERGAPRRAVRDALADSFDPQKPAVTSLSGLGRDGGRRQGIAVLAGGTGCGKTVAAVRWLVDWGGSAPLFCRASAFEAAGRYDRAFRAQWLGATGMVLDDLGMEYADGKGNLLADIDELLDHYHGRERSLVVTTNMQPEPFFRRYGVRIQSRLRQSGQWWNVSGADMRTPVRATQDTLRQVL